VPNVEWIEHYQREVFVMVRKVSPEHKDAGPSVADLRVMATILSP
jgi:hypothetical protein